MAATARLIIFGCLLIVCAGCGLSAIGYAYNAAYYGIKGVGMMGEYHSPTIERGPGVEKGEIATINRFAFCFCGALNKDNSDEFNSLSVAFLDRLIRELPKDADGKVVSEEELKPVLPAGKTALDLQDYLAAAHALDLKAIIKVTNLTYQGSKINGFKFVMWDARTPEKKRLLLTTQADFKNPHTVDEAAISIAKTFFKASEKQPEKAIETKSEQSESSQ